MGVFGVLAAAVAVLDGCGCVDVAVSVSLAVGLHMWMCGLLWLWQLWFAVAVQQLFKSAVALVVALLWLPLRLCQWLQPAL
jgi:hypothetical protein